MRTIILITISIYILSCSNSKVDSKRDEIKIKDSIVNEESYQATKKEYKLDSIKIELIQKKGDCKNFCCNAKLKSIQKGKAIDSIEFNNIEPVGSAFGISKAYILKNHIIFNKYGDYDGRTLIINKNGKIFNLIGGHNFIDEDNKLIFTIYISDVPGLCIFNLNTDSILFKNSVLKEEPISIYKSENRYYIKYKKNKSQEIKFNKSEILLIEKDKSRLNSKNKLFEIPYQGNTNCLCD